MMKRLALLTFALIFWTAALFPQTVQNQLKPISKSDFSGTLSFLASDWMEGREAGAKGGFMAADYISSMMENNGLLPFGDNETSKNISKRSYFQDFEVIRYKTESAALSLISKTETSKTEFQLIPAIDFEVEAFTNSLTAEAPLVFAGYGISAPDFGYDDYKKLETKGCIIIVLEGFPGHADTTSAGWKKFGKSYEDGDFSRTSKLKTAAKLGAVAIIEVNPDGSFKPSTDEIVNLSVVQSAMKSEKPADPEYEDFSYILLADTSLPAIPSFKISSKVTNEIFEGTGISLTDAEKKAANSLETSATLIKDKIAGISITVKSESLLVRNVLGVIPGKDSTKSVVVGAHYDHLGIRDCRIYNGSDDNASGVAGMLAMAKSWASSNEKPACNLIFAAWTAEEKGLLGSSFFVQNPEINNKNIPLYINFDMISRSAPEDSTQLIVSVGTVKGSDSLKNLASKNNGKLARPFNLDLWECSENGGSDYASFATKKIPVMTFFSGFHDDYHSPRDISAKADLEKMAAILNLTNNCLYEFLDSE
jgi:hypothetical protein